MRNRVRWCCNKFVTSMRLVRYYEDRFITLGRLYINGAHFCDTIEPPSRQYYGRIKPRQYKVIEYPSKKYSRMMPLLTPTAPRAGILIHPGNKAQDTKGCILVGSANGRLLQNSRNKFCELYNILALSWKEGRETTIEIVEEF